MTIKPLKIKVFLASLFVTLFMLGSHTIAYAVGNYTVVNVTTGTTASGLNWRGIAMSNSGQYQASVVRGGDIYTSEDYGLTWTSRTQSGALHNLNWSDISVNSDGSKMYAVEESGNIYSSSDYGNSWNNLTSGSALEGKVWYGVSSSSSGSRVAAISTGSGAGNVYTSQDYGATWQLSTETTGNGLNYLDVAISGSGQFIIAGVWGNDGGLYGSADYGATWSDISTGTAIDSLFFWSLDISDNGQYMLVSTLSGTFLSSDFGTTWSSTPITGFSRSSSSASGRYMVAAETGGDLFTSSDFGMSWENTTPSGDGHLVNWNKLAMSGTGEYISGNVSNGDIYRAEYTGEIPIIDDSEDNDGIDKSTEEASPNNGDSNNDDTPDSQQAYVASYLNTNTAKYATLEVDPTCNITRVNSIPETDNVDDSQYTYPAGLMDFTIDCVSNGYKSTITQYYYGLEGEYFVIRKYNPNSNNYLTIDTATIEWVEIDGERVLRVSYEVIDGSELDADGVANGVIVDPAGPAVAQENPSPVGAPDTGLISSDMTVYVSATTAGVLLLLCYLGFRNIYIRS